MQSLKATFAIAYEVHLIFIERLINRTNELEQTEYNPYDVHPERLTSHRPRPYSRLHRPLRITKELLSGTVPWPRREMSRRPGANSLLQNFHCQGRWLLQGIMDY